MLLADCAIDARTGEFRLLPELNLAQYERIADVDERGKEIVETVSIEGFRFARAFVGFGQRAGLYALLGAVALREMCIRDRSEEALDLAPHARKEFQIAYPKDLQGDFAVLFTMRQLFDAPLVPAGHVLGFEQLGRQRYAAPVRDEGVLESVSYTHLDVYKRQASC